MFKKQNKNTHTKKLKGLNSLVQPALTASNPNNQNLLSISVLPNFYSYLNLKLMRSDIKLCWTVFGFPALFRESDHLAVITELSQTIGLTNTIWLLSHEESGLEQNSKELLRSQMNQFLLVSWISWESTLLAPNELGSTLSSHKQLPGLDQNGKELTLLGESDYLARLTDAWAVWTVLSGLIKKKTKKKHWPRRSAYWWMMSSQETSQILTRSFHGTILIWLYCDSNGS